MTPPPEEPARERRSWPQRVLITFNCLLIVTCLATAGYLGYLFNRIRDLPQIDFAEGVLDEAPEEGTEDDDPGGPKNYLLVGSDTREGQDAASFGTTEDSAGERSDTMMLVRIDPKAEKAAMVSFPRDLWIEIYDRDLVPQGRQRINTAFEDGPQGLVATIRENYDIPIHHYAQVDFAGFRELVEVVDGVELYLAGSVRDRDPETGENIAGLDIAVDGPGCVELNGQQALAYVRSRHFEQFVDGDWVLDPRGDLGRNERQQDFVRRAVREALSKGLTNPLKINRLLDVAEGSIKIDDELDGGDMVSIGRRFQTLTPETLDQRAFVVEQFRTDGGAAVLRLADDPANLAIFDLFRGVVRGPETVSPSEVTIRVVNGTGRSGEAGGARDALEQAGFQVVGVGDGAFGTEVTTVRYATGQEAAADLVARHLASEGALLVPDDSLTVDLMITTGDDYEGVDAVPRPAPAAPAPEEAPAEPAEEPTGDGGSPDDGPAQDC